MNNAQVLVLRALRKAQDIYTLKNAIVALCGPSGPVTSYQVVFNANKRMVCCLLQIKSRLPDSEMRELGAYRFGGLVRLEFPVGAQFGRSTWTSSDLPARGEWSPSSPEERAAP